MTSSPELAALRRDIEDLRAQCDADRRGFMLLIEQLQAELHQSQQQTNVLRARVNSNEWAA